MDLSFSDNPAQVWPGYTRRATIQIVTHLISQIIPWTSTRPLVISVLFLAAFYLDIAPNITQSSSCVVLSDFEKREHKQNQ